MQNYLMPSNIMPNNIMIDARPHNLMNNVLAPNFCQQNQPMLPVQANNQAHYPIYQFPYAPYTQTSQGFVIIQPNILATNGEQSNQSVQNSSSIDPMNKMSPEQIAHWIGEIARDQKWTEADTYSDLFRGKKVSGEQILKMNYQTLLSAVGIKKLGHRLEILRSVEELNSDPERCREVMDQFECMSTCSNSDTSPVSNRAPSTPEPRDELVIHPEKIIRSDNVPSINFD